MISQIGNDVVFRSAISNSALGLKVLDTDFKAFWFFNRESAYIT